MRDDKKSKQQSFSVLVLPHLDTMYRLAYRLTQHREDAQDLVQDVLIKLYPRIDQLDGVDAAAAWLNRVLYNQFIDNQRRYKARRLRIVSHPELSSDPDRAPSDEPQPDDAASGEFTISRLQAAFDKLSDDHRLILMLHDVEGYSLPEVAEMTGIPLGTLKSRRFRARQRLQSILDEGSETTSITSRQGRGERNDELRPVPAKLGSVS